MKNYLNILKKSPIFFDINESELKSVLNCMGAITRKYNKDSYIFNSGEKTEFMGLMLSGSALIIQEDIWGNRNIISNINPGQTFGEVFASSKDSILNVSVLANENSEIILLNIKKLITLCPCACDFHNKVIRNLVSVLASKSLVLNEKITHMSKRTTREKLLSFLSSTAQKKNSLIFDIDFDRQQLSDYLCVQRSAMSTELSKLKKEGLIDFEKNHFILNINKN